jgi:hypothetical protein
MMQENLKPYFKIIQEQFNRKTFPSLGSGVQGVRAKYESGPLIRSPFMSILSTLILGISDNLDMSEIPLSVCLKEGLVLVSTTMGNI